VQFTQRPNVLPMGDFGPNWFRINFFSRLTAFSTANGEYHFQHRTGIGLGKQAKTTWKQRVTILSVEPI
jgi:hypothetical protein